MDGSNSTFPDCIKLVRGADVPASIYGARAATVVDMMQSDVPIPQGWAFTCETVAKFQRSEFPKEWPLAEALKKASLSSLRASPI